MTLTRSFQVLGLAFIVSLLFISYLLNGQKAYGSAPAGLQATVATTSNPTVSATAAVVFATSTCAARVISTSASPIMITFSDYANQTPTGSFGHPQAASTTVSYDSGQYGCGLVKVYSYATQLMTVSESR